MMRIVKPQRIGLLYKPFEHLGQFRLAVSAVLFLPFEQPRYLLPEIAMWKFVAKAFGKDAIFDLGMPKPRAEAMVLGKCFAPSGTPVTRSQVRLLVGDPQKPLVDKRLNIFGDRAWQQRATGPAPGEPAPFVEMPIDHAHAFGGAAFPQNPLGKGHAPLAPDAKGQVLHPLPNVEDARTPIVSPQDRPAPASFAPLDFTWPQRASKAGTYDEQWLKTRFPAYADDMDLSIFNAAPSDQWLPAFFKGDEAFAVHGMHREKAEVRGTLPGAAVRCFLKLRDAKGPTFRDVGMRPETLWLVPDAQRAILVFRGVTAIDTDDAADVEALMLAAEAMDAPRTIEYYRDLLEVRLDPVDGGVHLLRDDQLLPPIPPRTAPLPDDNGAEDWLYQVQGHQRSRLRTKIEREIAKVKDDLVEVRAKVLKSREDLQAQHSQLSSLPPSAAVDAKKTELATAIAAIAGQLAEIERIGELKMPPDPPPTPLEELPALKKKLIAEAKAAQAEARAQLAVAEQNTRQSLQDSAKRTAEMREQASRAGAKPEQLEKMSIDSADYDQMMKREARLGIGGPPKPIAPPVVAQLRDEAARMRVPDVKLPSPQGMPADAAAGVAAAEARLASAQSATAGAAKSLQDGLPQLERQLQDTDQRIAQMYRRGAHVMPPARALDAAANARVREAVVAAHAKRERIAGADFTGADLSGLSLAGVDLQDALMEGVDFSGTDLSGANLAGTVLARATFAKARLGGAKLAGANLGFADLRGTNLAGADLCGAILSNASLQQADLTGAKLDKAELLGARLAGANLSRVSAPEANFLNVDLRAPDEQPEFGVEHPPPPPLDMRGAKFAGANLQKAKFVDCILEEIDFSGANLSGAILVGAQADRCRFGGADLSKAMFVKASSLADGDFRGARLDGASLRGANLTNGDFTGCSAQYTDFTEARLTKARFGGAMARGARFTKADLTLAKMEGANLMEGMLQKAQLHGTRLAGANLFGADLLRIKVDDGTDFSRTNRERTLAGAVEKK